MHNLGEEKIKPKYLMNNSRDKYTSIYIEKL